MNLMAAWIGNTDLNAADRNDASDLVRSRKLIRSGHLRKCCCLPIKSLQGLANLQLGFGAIGGRAHN
jgi:hypothetical protein